MAIRSIPMIGRVVLTDDDATAFLRQIADPHPLTATEKASRERAARMAQEYAEKGSVKIALGFQFSHP